MNNDSRISERILLSARAALEDWEKGNGTLDESLDEIRAESPLEAGAVSSILFEYFRHKAFIDNVIRKHAKREEVNLEMRALIACALTQIFFQTGIAWQSAVNIAVDTAKYFRGIGGASFVNAILRSVLRDGTLSRGTPIEKTFPPELLTRWSTKFGVDTAKQMASHFADNPPLTFRARAGFTDADATAIKAEPMPDQDWFCGFRFYRAPDTATVIQSRLIEEGKIYVQDTATAMALSLLGENKPEGRVLDACAAPGGKSIMLWDLAPTSRIMLTAGDRSKRRMIRMNYNLRQAGVRARSIEMDAVSAPFSDKTFDFVFADVPCTNTGVIRRRPDVPWRFSERRLAETVALQKDILEGLARLVKTDGRLLYSTCSVEPEEDELQIEKFLANHPEFVCAEERKLLPDAEYDGAYGALLKRVK